MEQFFGTRIGADDFEETLSRATKSSSRIERLLDEHLVPRRRRTGHPRVADFTHNV